jgi:hypothetical protein
VTRYSPLLGRRVEAVYLFGIIELFACGVLLSFSADDITIEQHSDQYGRVKTFKLKIPCSWIVRLQESRPGSAPAAS